MSFFKSRRLGGEHERIQRDIPDDCSDRVRHPHVQGDVAEPVYSERLAGQPVVVRAQCLRLSAHRRPPHFLDTGQYRDLDADALSENKCVVAAVVDVHAELQDAVHWEDWGYRAGKVRGS
jgi:hypothetical protein